MEGHRDMKYGGFSCLQAVRGTDPGSLLMDGGDETGHSGFRGVSSGLMEGDLELGEQAGN